MLIVDLSCNLNSDTRNQNRDLQDYEIWPSRGFNASVKSSMGIGEKLAAFVKNQKKRRKNPSIRALFAEDLPEYTVTEKIT